MDRVEEYFKTPGLSSSFLKKVIKNDFSKEEDSKEKYVSGNLVDARLTFVEELNNYIGLDVKYPPPQIKATFDQYLKENNTWDITKLKDLYNDLYNSKRANPWKLTTVIKALNDEKHYILNKLKYKDKIVIPKETWDKSIACANSLKEHPLTRKYFESDNKYQVPLFARYRGHYCKGLLDILRINKSKKEIQIVDVKSTDASTKYWPEIARKLRADLQLSFYYNLVKINYPSYTQLNPVFLVESVKNPGFPRIYELDTKHRLIGKEGGIRTRNTIAVDSMPGLYKSQDVILGYDNAIDIYEKHLAMKIHHFDVEYGKKQILDLW